MKPTFEIVYEEQTPYGPVVIDKDQTEIYHDYTAGTDGSHDANGAFRDKAPLISQDVIRAGVFMFSNADVKCRRILVREVTVEIARRAGVAPPEGGDAMEDDEDETTDALFSSPRFLASSILHMFILAVTAGGIKFTKPQ